MPGIRTTEDFDDWLAALRDARAIAKIVTRIKRLGAGNPGDVKPVGEGLSEMRIPYGPGYRVYFKRFGAVLVIVLCGGDKSTQAADIARARKLANEIEL
jgi:putative addiction module killer protein